jgi:hypothetical protein
MKNKIIITLHEPSKDDMTLAVSAINSFLESFAFKRPGACALLTSTMDINGTPKERSVLYESLSVIDLETEYAAYLQSKALAMKAN